MSKKLHSKLLSVILCIAICCATLCGSIIAVNAAAADYNGTYTISVGDEKQAAVLFSATEVKAKVTFELPAGFVGGQFTAKAAYDAEGNLIYSIGKNATIVAATDADDNELTADEIAAKTTVGDNGEAPAFEIVNKANDSDMMFRFTLDDFYTSITIEYTIIMSSYVSGGGSTKYAVDIEVDGANFAVNGDYANVTFNGSTAYFHTHYPYYYNKPETPDNAHTVFECGCYHCDITSKQLLPDYTLFDGASAVWRAALGWMGISGINVIYDEDGTFDLNVHAYSQYHTDKVFLLVTDSEGNEIMRTGTYNNAKSSSLAGENGLHESLKVFSVENLSARDIEKELLFTLIAVYNESEVMTVHNSRTVSFSLANYCLKVVDGEAVWPEGTLDAQKDADKDVAAALYYYGASIQDSVFDKNTSAGSDIEYVNANYDEWDGKKVQPTETDADGNIIIRNAEQLAWIALEGATATANKNYKVADNSVFNMMGMQGITLDSTVSQVKAATKNTDRNWRLVSDSAGNAFKGNFDGNGLIAYNVYSSGWAHGGLFPCIKPEAASTITIKNVMVVASYMSAYHYAGGVIGLADAPGTNTSVVIDSLVAKNTYIYDMDYPPTNVNGNPHQRVAGTIVGGLSHNGTTINNCAAINNEISAQGIVGGLFGDTSNYGSNVTVSNSITIGTSKEPTAKETALGSKVAKTTYTNVYTEDVAAATLGSTWFDTETYPELSIFHKLSKQYVDENTHKVICLLKASDNTCGLKGLTEAHTLSKNAEGTAKVCECGYSVPIYKDIEYIAANYDEWDGTMTAPTKGTGTQADPYLIENAEQLAFIALSLDKEFVTKDKYFKVADGIKAFNMQGMSGVTLDSTSNEVKSLTNTGKTWRQTADIISSTSNENRNVNYAFSGNFDGNGVTIYNMHYGSGNGHAYSGLFPCVYQEGSQILTFKNVTVVASYFKGYHAAAGIVGHSFALNTGSQLSFENVVVKNSYIISDLHNKRAAGLVADMSHNKISVNNCAIIDNDMVGAGTLGGFFSNSSAYSGGCDIKNSIVIGTVPTHPSNASVNANATYSYSNIYTDQTFDASYTGITKAVPTASQLGSDWFDTETYPELSIFHEMTDEYVNENTHKSVCIITINGANCTTCGVPVEHTMVKNDETKKMQCTCGYYEDIIGNTVTPNNVGYDTWDGSMTAPTIGTGTESDPYIIENAEQMAFIALDLNGTFETYGKYFKVADGIKCFDMKGMSDINVNSTSDEVKGKSNAGRIWRQTAEFVSWGDTPNHTNAFGGNFDGNGVTIINMHYGSGNGHGYSGLFPATYLEGSSTMTFKNFTVAASYFNGYHTAAGVIGYAYAKNTSSKISFENVVIKNNYIATNTHNQRGAGLVADASHNKIIVNNCLILNNEIVAANMLGGFFANASGYSGGCDIRNSLIVGTVPTHPSNATVNAAATYAYTNVYTDQDFDNVYTGITKGIPTAAQLGSAWFDTETYPELSIFHDMVTVYVDANTHQNVCQHFINGTQCTTVAPTATHTMVDAEDGKSSNCKCGYSYEIKGIHAMNLPDSILKQITKNDTYIEKFATNALFKDAYNEDIFSTDGTIENVFDMYTTSLNLKVNPHIGFMFAFHGDHKTNRNKISVTFTVLDNDYDTEVVLGTYTTDCVELSNGELGTNWVNNSGAGRYHLYRFKQLPVKWLCEDIKVTVNYNGADFNFGKYSAAGYTINAMNAGEDYQEHVNASMALVYYSEMLAARASK